MKSKNEAQRLAGSQTKPKKSRFKIEKLEERIAPSHACHYRYRGRTGTYHGHCYDDGYPPGWYKNGKV